MTAFTHYWSNDTVADALANGDQGELLDHVAGSRFLRQGVKEGDTVYVVTVIKGQLYLVGKMVVSQIAHTDEEARALLGYEPWSAPDHLIGDKSQCTRIELNRAVPLQEARALTFESEKGAKGLVFKSDSQLDQQTLRGVRQLTPESAKLLDSFL